MSRTEKRNGEQIYNIALSINLNPSEESMGFMTVGQVAACSEFSKATCKKYLDVMVKSGAMERAKIAGMGEIYRFVSGL
jgi:response regulator of citrate/malate metabolism